ncbi:MAG: peroxidase family protein [Microcoleaceae cyanobacterium MO_207.B10]|nr:peroxidase family protein [Microcoleaceae cyanobacterium MO_207.B10]
MVFRTFDGSNNNQNRPEYGKAGENLLRFTEVAYADGISELANPDGPNPRSISNAVFNQQEESIPDPRNLSDYVWAWEQFVDHDITHTFLQSGNEAESANIIIPQGDSVYTPGSFIPVSRSLFDPDTGTDTSNPRQQPNEITAWLDGSQVYGSDETTANWLRSFDGGKLKVSTHSTGDLLPTKGDDPNAPEMAMDEAIGANTFIAGDVRANEHAVLTSLHTLFVREHNRLAEVIDATHTDLPSDSAARDEEIYQRARKIVGAEMQAITYNEYLPALGVSIDPYNGYNANVNPGINTEFSTAAFRLGHSQVSGILKRLDEDGTPAAVGELDLFEGFFQPERITEDGGIEPVLRGLASQVQQKTDSKIVEDLRDLLFTGVPGGGPVANGTDLAALNIQRGRDHGLGNYNQVRAVLGLPTVNDFGDISSDPEVVANLEELYGDVDNIDLWVGMLSEDNLTDASIGELNEAILEDQFERLRDGDRFWYENDADLTQWQLGENGTVLDWLDNLKLSDIVKLNTEIENIPNDVFFVPDIVTNTNDSGPGSLRDAIANAEPGGTIVFAPDVQGETINLTSGQLRIDKDINIDGNENNPVRIDAGGNSRVLNINDGDNNVQSQVTIDGVIVSDGNVSNTGGDGGGILNREDLTLSNSIVSGNTANEDGGGIFNSRTGKITITNSTIRNNQTMEGYASGAGIFNSGEAEISDSEISNNFANDTGGGVYTLPPGNTTIINSTITGNSANNDGGGVFVYGDTEIVDSTISNNVALSAIADGGGISNFGNAEIRNSTIIGNSAGDDGGGIYNKDNVFGKVSTVVITNSTIRENTAASDGGGVFNFGVAEIEDTTITENNAPDAHGSGIASFGNTSITSTTVTSSIVTGNVNTDVDFVTQSQNSFISGGGNTIGDGNAIGNFNASNDQTGVVDSLIQARAIVGTDSEDTMIGDNQQNTLIGNESNDILRGRRNNDILIGVNADADNPGRNEVDRLWGNRGGDTFILGDEKGVYYDDGRRNRRGGKDRGIIQDFNPDADQIQLHGSAEDYQLRLTQNKKHTRIFYVTDQNKPELIAQVQNQTELSLDDSNQFKYVGLSTAETEAEYVGTDGKDILTGDSQDNILIGNEGNDRLRGLEGDDELIGVNPDGRKPGIREVDRLWGNEGIDRFILGDAETVYYDDRRRNTGGGKDRAIIYDFDANEDQIQLHGNAEDYELRLTRNENHTRIFYVADQNKPELIAQVQNHTDLVLGSEQFDFV